MAKQTIIDWQRDGLLVAITSGRLGSTTIDSISQQVISDDPASGSRTASEALSKAAAELGLGKGDVIVVACREIVEVRTISIPRIDPDELPDVIRFQAQRQLANMGDNWKLDYVLLPDDGQEMLTALVGAMAPDRLAVIEAACVKCNLQVQHIALRPIEIARQAMAVSANSEPAALVLCVSEDMADLIVTKKGQVVLVRNNRLPGEASQIPAVLNGEIRRTLMAASTALAGSEIEQVLLIAAPAVASVVEVPIEKTVGCPVKRIDPSEWLGRQAASAVDLAKAEPQRIAGICGAAGVPLADKKTIIDFKDPKKRPPKKKNTLRYGLMGAAAGLLLLAGVSWWINTNRHLDNELALLTAEVEGKQDVVASANAKIAMVSEIRQFAEGSPNYLDELAYMAENIPGSRKVRLASPMFSSLNDGSGQIRVYIEADSFDSISEFEKSLSDEDHSVLARDPQMKQQAGDLYQVEAIETISIANRGWKLVDKLDTSRRATAPAPSAAAVSSSPESPSSSESSESSSGRVPASNDDATPEDHSETRTSD